MDTLIDGTFEPGTVKLGDNTVAGVKYTYYLGYVSEVKDNRVAIQGDRTVGSYAGRTNLRLNAESIVTEINTNHASGVKVTFGDTGSFVADSGLANNIADGDGDIVFIKAMNDVVIVEAVVYKAN